MYIPKYRRNLIDAIYGFFRANAIGRWWPAQHLPFLPCIECPFCGAGLFERLQQSYDPCLIPRPSWWLTIEPNKSGRRHGDSTCWHIHMCANRPRPSAARLHISSPPPSKTIKISQNISFSHGIKQIKNQIKTDSRQAKNKTKKNKREMVAWKTCVRSND